MAVLDGCVRGKHDFGRWYYAKESRPVLDEFFRFRCHTCGIWCWRSDVGALDVEELRKSKKRVKWELSSAQDKEARIRLQTYRLELLGGSPGVRSAGSPGVDSPRSPGVDSQRPRKAVNRG